MSPGEGPTRKPQRQRGSGPPHPVLQGLPCSYRLSLVSQPGRTRRAGSRSPPTTAPGLSPPPGAHWPAPQPQPAERVGRGRGGGGLSPPSRPQPGGGGASPGGQTGLGGVRRGAGEGRRGPPRSGGDSGGFRRVRSPRTHTHTPAGRDPRPRAAGQGTHADTRDRRALLGAHAPQPCAAPGADSPLRASPRSLPRADPPQPASPQAPPGAGKARPDAPVPPHPVHPPRPQNPRPSGTSDPLLQSGPGQRGASLRI